MAKKMQWFSILRLLLEGLEGKDKKLGDQVEVVKILWS